MAAPSADNRHVIQLRVEADTVRLWATQELERAHFTRRILGLLSTGAVAENLVLRARRLGWQLEPRWVPCAESPALLAEFDCTACEVGPEDADPSEQAIEHRHTNRRLRFRGPPLGSAEQQAFSARAQGIPGAAVHWLDSSERRRLALRLIRRAETERFRNRPLHRELFDAIRFDVGWHATALEGLPPATLELPAIERPAFALLRHWPVQRAGNLFGAHHFVGWRAADLPCRLAPHLCAITASGDLDAAALSAGRLLQRLWLQATVHGLAFQVYGGAAIYALDRSTDIDPAFRTRLAEDWARLLPAGKETRPMVVFRMGHARPPALRAGRPEARELLDSGPRGHAPG